MNVPANLKYADSHEWLRAESDGTVTVGITDHAQAALGDLVFVELPAVGRQLVVGGAKTSAGQSLAAPSQVSATSQTPAEARQVVPALALTLPR